MRSTVEHFLVHTLGSENVQKYSYLINTRPNATYMYMYVLYIRDKSAELLPECSIEKLEREYQEIRFGQLKS